MYGVGCSMSVSRPHWRCVMDEMVPRPVAERVRTVLARGASGSVESGTLTRPLRSARVRDDGVVVLVVDVTDDSRQAGGVGQPPPAGATPTVEILDTVCTSRCRDSAPRPSFALDGRLARPASRGSGCDDECAFARGIVTIVGIVKASSAARRRRLVAADGSATDARSGGGTRRSSALRMGELQPLEITYTAADGVHVVPPEELAAARVDPIGVDEPAWLRRFAADTGFAARLALRSGLQITGAHPRVVGLDRSGIELAVNPPGAGFPEVVRLPFSRVCRDADDVQRELAGLAR